MKVYKFELLVDEDGKVGIRHNCDNLVEFLGILELAKAIGLKMFQSAVKEEKKIDPNEYLKQVLQNTKQVEVKGIIKTIQ